MSIAVAHISGVQADVINMAGDVTTGGQLTYSAIVLDTSNKPVANAGNPVGYGIAGFVTFTFATPPTVPNTQAAITADIRNKWNDQTITVMFI